MVVLYCIVNSECGRLLVQLLRVFEGDRATCRVEDGGRISLTFRAVHTFLDRDTGCLFGQAVAASCNAPPLEGDGAITEVALSLAFVSMRE